MVTPLIGQNGGMTILRADDRRTLHIVPILTKKKDFWLEERAIEPVKGDPWRGWARRRPDVMNALMDALINLHQVKDFLYLAWTRNYLRVSTLLATGHFTVLCVVYRNGCIGFPKKDAFALSQPILPKKMWTYMETIVNTQGVVAKGEWPTFLPTFIVHLKEVAESHQKAAKAKSVGGV